MKNRAHQLITVLTKYTLNVTSSGPWLIPYSGELYNKTYHQDFRDGNHLKRILLLCWVR